MPPWSKTLHGGIFALCPGHIFPVRSVECLGRRQTGLDILLYSCIIKEGIHLYYKGGADHGQGDQTAGRRGAGDHAGGVGGGGAGAVISEEDYKTAEGKGVLHRLYGDSVAGLVTALYDGKAIGEEDLRELRAFLDGLEGK